MKDKKIEKLISKAAEGDQKAVQDLCEQKAGEILYITTKIMKNRQDGEDAAQEVLIYMKDHIHKLKYAQAFNVWLYRIINGVCMNLIRKNRKTITKDLNDLTADLENRYQTDSLKLEEQRMEFLPYEFLERSDKRTAIFEVLDELPERYRLCIYLYYFKEMNYKEISAALDISLKDVDNALARGKKAIKNRIEKDPDMKKFLTKVPAVAPIPVLTRIMEQDFEEMVSAEAVKKILSVTGKGAMIFWTSTNAVRLLLSCGALTGVIAAGIMMNTRGPVKEGNIAPMNRTEITEYKEPGPPSEAAADPGRNIETLEDMIGIREARRLRAFAGTDFVNRGELLTFLDQIGMQTEEGIWNPYRMQEHDLFVLEKENRLLMVILFHNVSADTCRIVFRFTFRDEPKPENIEIMIVYEKWSRNHTYRGE